MRVGPDDRPTMLWTTPSGTTVVWTLRAEGDAPTIRSWAPRPNWTPVAAATGFDGLLHVLSLHGNGTLELRKYGPDGSVSLSQEIAPIDGFTPRDFALGPDGVAHLGYTQVQTLLLVRLTPGGGLTSSGYEQQPGWIYEGMGVGADGRERVQWGKINSVALWSVGPDWSFTYRGLGPVDGWTPLGFGAMP